MEWSRLECEAIVSDYFAMFYSELKGDSYSKAKHRRALHNKLLSRSDGSIEYKHQNISAILIKAGRTYIKGYKPAWNYQALLQDVVLQAVNLETTKLHDAESILAERPPTQIKFDNWNSFFVESPEKVTNLKETKIREYRPPYVDYIERESRNQKLGKNGEKFVLNVEKARLLSFGRDDLIEEIEWTSQVKGDGTGYDIRSFKGETDEELFIEVKTTNAGKYQPFFITNNEINYSESFAEKYALYRVFEFSYSPNIFTLNGKLEEHVNLVPELYKATF